MVTCPDGGSNGHAFCQLIGCDYCVAVVQDEGPDKFECDGSRQAGNVTIGAGARVLLEALDMEGERERATASAASNKGRPTAAN